MFFLLPPSSLSMDGDLRLLQENKALGHAYDNHHHQGQCLPGADEISLSPFHHGNGHHQPHPAGSEVGWSNNDEEDDDHRHHPDHINQRTVYWESQLSMIQEILEDHRSTGAKLREEITLTIEEAREGDLCRCLQPKSYTCFKCLRERVVSLLCSKGINATLRTSKWAHTTEFPGGTHEYIEVIASTPSRKKLVSVLIEINFRDEFKMAKACKEYMEMINELPEIYIGKSQHLNAIVNIVCDAAKRSTTENKIHMGPWRKRSFMHKKWSASSSSSSSYSKSEAAASIASNTSLAATAAQVA